MEAVLDLLEKLLPGLIVAVVMAYWNRKQAKIDAGKSERERLHVKSEGVKLSLLLAGAKLSYATAMAIKRGTFNGEMEDALPQYEEALDKFREFERERMTEL